MSNSVADIHERLMTAMRSLDVLERDVRSCLAAVRARFDIEHGIPALAAEGKRQKGVADSNLQAVLRRRKELGRLWGLDLEEMSEGLVKVQVERLLKPLRKCTNMDSRV